MPDYKRRKHSRISAMRKKPIRQAKSRVQIDSDIKMTPSAKKKPPARQTENMKLVKGRKPERRRRARLIAVTVAAVLAVCTVLHVIMPAGIFETLSNATALLGGGSYPIELEGTQALNAASNGSYYYVLTDSYVYAFTNSGKKLFSYAHGFENPVIKLSSSRAIVFNQGGNSALIFNNRGLKADVTSEQKIITAAISDSGVYALSAHSDKYASAVSVYSKNGTRLYEWFSANETVNNVAVSPSGKKIAVSGFDSSVGQYKSTVSVLGFKSATPEYTESFDGDLIYSIDTSSPVGFTLVMKNRIKLVKWNKYKTVEYKNDYDITFYKASKNGAVAVFGRESDKTDNKIALLSKSGEVKAELQYKAVISDIQLFGNHIYFISEADAFLLDTDGKLLRSAACGFGAVRLAVTGTNSVAVITDNKIERIKLEQES